MPLDLAKQIKADESWGERTAEDYRQSVHLPKGWQTGKRKKSLSVACVDGQLLNAEFYEIIDSKELCVRFELADSPLPVFFYLNAP